MKAFLKENGNHILLLLLVSLLFLLWGRMMAQSLRESSAICNLSTTEARIRCVNRFGWEVHPADENAQKIKLPEHPSQADLEYNKLQKMCGFDLLPYYGKTVMRYRYIAQNYPYAIKEPVYIELLIADDTMIAGACRTFSENGFVLPIDRRFAP